MRQTIILAALGFVLILIVRLPARWVSPLLPHEIHCQQLDGSVWSGNCTGLASGVTPLGDLSWDLNALQLLRGRLGLKMDLTNQGSYLRGNVAWSVGGAIHGRDVSLDIPLTNALSSSIPAGTRAHLSGTLASFEWNGKFLSELQGQLDIQDLVAPQGAALGSFQATFVPGTGGADTPTGAVHDTGGPLSVDATVQLTHDPGYLLEGQIAARPSASASFADSLKYLGAADASGRRHFSLSGTF